MVNEEAPSGRGSVTASIASVASLIAALSCCLPIGTLLMAAGSAGASMVSESLRPWLLALSVACLVFAFVQTYFRQRCAFRHRRLRTVLLWFSALAVTAMLAAPNQFATLVTGRLPSFRAQGRLIPFDAAAFGRDFAGEAAHKRMVVLLSPT